ncbi:MAG: hypothetical protein ABEH66_01520 [Halobacteriales archaeon]
MTRTRTLFAVVAALLIASAGCSSIGSQGSPAGDPEETPTAGTPTPDGEEIRASAVDAMDAVETYRVVANESRTVIANRAQEILIEQTVTVDRTSGSLHVAANQSVAGRTIALDIYLVDGTLYQRSRAYVRQFSTEWLEVDTVENVSRVRTALDPLRRQQRLLEATNVTINGTETVDGTETYRLETSSDPERLEEVFAEQVSGPGSQLNESTYSISNASFTFWISTETTRPVKAVGAIDSTVSARGQTVSLEQSFSFQYDYESEASVDLPEGAESAVPLSEALNGTGTGA